MAIKCIVRGSGSERSMKNRVTESVPSYLKGCGLDDFIYYSVEESFTRFYVLFVPRNGSGQRGRDSSKRQRRKLEAGKWWK